MTLLHVDDVETVCAELCEHLTRRVLTRRIETGRHRVQLAADICLHVAEMRVQLLRTPADVVRDAVVSVSTDPARSSWLDHAERSAIVLAVMLDAERRVGQDVD